MIIKLLIIGLALSMDTFTLSLLIGLSNSSKKIKSIYPLIVGILHFIFPIIGNFLGNYIIKIITISSTKFLGLIFLLLFIKLLLDYKKNKEIEINFNCYSLLLLAISVSMDSLIVGIGINSITYNILLPSLVFFIESCIFTYIGIIIGKESNKTLGKKANIIGMILLLIISIIQLCK